MTSTDELESQIHAQDCELEYWLQQADNYAEVQIPADDLRAIIARAYAAVNALPELLAEVEVLRRLAPEYFQWAGKSGADAAPEWLQDRLKYGSASVDGDMLAVYDWHGRRSLAAPGDYVVHGEEWLWVLPARAALKEPAQ